MARNKHFRPEQVEAIVAAIHDWNRETISWDQVCKLAKPILGYLPSRSGLSAHTEIQAAFSARKKNLGRRPEGRLPAPGSLAEASRMIAKRDSELATLVRQVGELREKFDRWRYNARTLNIKLEQLDKPLPPIDRTR